MGIKLFDSELKILDILWNEGDITAREIAEILHNKIEWSKTTTYTVIEKCIEKGAISRQEPNFICHALITREQARQYETTELINRMYGGVADQLIASLLGRKSLTRKEIEQLKKIVSQLE